MKRLILMRHAKTEPWNEGLEDSGRALTVRGKRDAERVGLALEEAGIRPDVALVSSARRTRETFAAMAAHLGGLKPVVLDGLYLADPDEIAEIVFAEAAAGTVLVIGHNPGLHQLISDLIRTGGSDDDTAARFLIERLPTGTAAIFSCDADTVPSPSSFRLQTAFWGRELSEGEAA